MKQFLFTIQSTALGILRKNVTIGGKGMSKRGNLLLESIKLNIGKAEEATVHFMYMLSSVEKQYFTKLSFL